jgi:hypothetical protein
MSVAFPLKTAAKSALKKRRLTLFLLALCSRPAMTCTAVHFLLFMVPTAGAWGSVILTKGFWNGIVHA